MKKPKVSVIVPIYNVEKYLQECIESILNQKLKNIEIILIDDNSPDNCPKICDYYKEKDSRVRVIHKKNEGLGLARNSGINIAVGEYISFVDSDDFISENMLYNLYNIAIREDADAVYSGIIDLFPNGKIKKNPNSYGNMVLKNNQIDRIMLDMLGSTPKKKKDQSFPISSCVAIYRKEIIDKNRLSFFSEREYISEDLIFNIYFLRNSKIVCTSSNCDYYYRKNYNSLTKRYNSNRFEKNIILYKKELELIHELGFKDANNRIQRTLLGNTRVCFKQIVTVSDLSFKNKIKEIKKICNNDVIQEVLDKYPYHQNPTKQKIISILMKHKMIYLIYLFCRIGGFYR